MNFHDILNFDIIKIIKKEFIISNLIFFFLKDFLSKLVYYFIF